MIEPAAAHLLCALLVAADLVARAWRLQLFVGAAGERLRFRDAFTLNVFGEAAATLTPLRVGGQPARLFGMARHGVSLEGSLVALALEGVTLYALVAATALGIAVVVAPEQLANIQGGVVDGATRMLPWVLPLALLASLVLWVVRREGGRRRRPALPPAPPSPARGWRARGRRLGTLLRSVPPGVLALSVPLNLVNIAARVAVLPLLVLTLPAPPDGGAVVLASFTLLYGQIFVPTPAGAGVVEAGFLAGAGGSLGAATLGLLFWWRVYTAGVGLVAGILLGVPRYGLRPLLQALRPRRSVPGPAPLAPDER